MSGDSFTLNNASNLYFQKGFTREVETAQTAIDNHHVNYQFIVAAAGPFLFQTLVLPLVGTNEDIIIAEDQSMTAILRWATGGPTPLQKINTIYIGTSPFFEYISINGPYIGIIMNGQSSMTVTPLGLIDRGPSSINLLNPPVHFIAGGL